MENNKAEKEKKKKLFDVVEHDINTKLRTHALINSLLFPIFSSLI